MFQGITDPNVQTALALLEARINYISNERRTLSSRLAVLEDDDDPRPVRPDGGLSTSTYPRSFGLVSVNPAGTVKLRGGYIIHGETRVDVSGGDVIVSGGTYAAPTYVTVRYTYGGSASLLPNSVGTFPLPVANSYWQQPILSVYQERGVVKVKEILWEGIIILPNVYA